MKYKRYPTLARAADALNKKGFEDQFEFERKSLKHLKSGKIYDPEEVVIVEYHRFFPEDSQQNQVSIVFALETFDGLRGLLVTTYNAYGKVSLLEFMDRVKIKARRQNAI